jgi:hypothetical protein
MGTGGRSTGRPRNHDGESIVVDSWGGPAKAGYFFKTQFAFNPDGSLLAVWAWE